MSAGSEEVGIKAIGFDELTSWLNRILISYSFPKMLLILTEPDGVVITSSDSIPERKNGQTESIILFLAAFIF